MNINQLEYFVEVYERKSFKKTAEYLMISQQGVSKVIKSLEDELQKKLFVRQRTGITNTRAGEELYIHAKNILNEFYCIEHMTRQKRKKITIYTIDSMIDYYLLEFLVMFQKKHPNITLKIMETTNDAAMEKLIKDQSDFAILQNKCTQKTVINEFLFEVPIVFLVNKDNPVAKSSSLDETDINNLSFAGRGFEYVLYDKAIKNWRKKNIHPVTITETNNPRVLIELAKENMAIVAVNEAVANHYKDSELVTIKNEDMSINDQMYLCYKENSSPESKMFRNELMQWVKTTK